MLLKKKKTSSKKFKRVKNPDDILAIFDIDSGQVFGALFKKEYGGYRLITKKKVLFSWDGKDFKYLTRGILKSVDETASQLAKYLPDGSEVATFCFLPSLLSVSSIETKAKDSTEEFILSQDLVSKWANDITAKFLAEKGNLPSLYDEDKPYLLENAIIKVTSNGYEWRGDKDTDTKTAVLNQYLSATSSKLILKIREKLLPIAKAGEGVRFASSTFAVFSTIRDINNDPDNFLIVDTRGELIDLMLVDDGVLSVESSLPFGERNIARQAAETGLGESLIDSFMAGTESGKINGKASSHVEKVMNKIKEPWMQNLSELLSHIKEKHPIPKKIWLVSAGPTGRQFASKTILGMDWRDFSYSGSISIKNPDLLLTPDGISTVLVLEKLFCAKILNIQKVLKN